MEKTINDKTLIFKVYCLIKSSHALFYDSNQHISKGQNYFIGSNIRLLISSQNSVEKGVSTS
jgi:hypothetical protein